MTFKKISFIVGVAYNSLSILKVCAFLYLIFLGSEKKSPACTSDSVSPSVLQTLMGWERICTRTCTTACFRVVFFIIILCVLVHFYGVCVCGMSSNGCGVIISYGHILCD